MTAAGATPGLGAASGGDPDGRYQGRLTDEDGEQYGKVTFKVARDGRLIKDLKALVLSVCINPNAIGGVEVIEVPFTFDEVRVNRNGRFSKAETVVLDSSNDSKQYYSLSGRLKNRRVRAARIVLERRCESHETFDAERRGR